MSYLKNVNFNYSRGGSTRSCACQHFFLEGFQAKSWNARFERGSVLSVLGADFPKKILFQQNNEPKVFFKSLI